ncbi:Calcium/calmodulin-dependent protein kinase (CaM kinase) II [Fasciola gigantica]|uniref:Calcium/calmodulin-dependent protein kinase (CaM kinase) II n=1 Tax=Fasciola gigantica TaxID=46835 RepID=A0A504YTA8_FASGI|nr:Calcium/calmodulin-dependent protein kinase (CaM kinase) II [Fasciola gigantica]
MNRREIPVFARKRCYELKDVLGRGAFGFVRRCIKTDTGVEYAAKLINIKGISRSELRTVEYEAEICRSLRHTNIVQLHDSFYSGEYFIMILDLITGGELFEDIVRRSFYSESSARDCIYHVLKAMAYIHDQNVIHRDLKPENLLLTSRKTNSDIKIADFGLAIRVADDLPHWNGLAGTYPYMAPEMIKGMAYTKAVDIWSIGVILYLLLSGHPPFWGKSDSALQAKIVRGEYHYDASSWSSVSFEARDLIDRMLTRHPTQRITAKQALRHQWIQHTELKISKVHLEQTVSQLRKFNARRKFKAAILTTIAMNRLLPHARSQPYPPIGFAFPYSTSDEELNIFNSSGRRSTSFNDLSSSETTSAHSVGKRITIVRTSESGRKQPVGNSLCKRLLLRRVSYAIIQTEPHSIGTLLSLPIVVLIF